MQQACFPRFRLWSLIPLLATGLLTACGSTDASSSTSSGAGSTDDACLALAAQCFATQTACVAPAGEGPRCEPCGSGHYSREGLACEPIGGTPVEHEFAEFTVGAGEEVLGLCQSWTLDNETELWVNAVELTQDEASHHSNWTYVTDDMFEGPDGVWPCDERGYSQLSAALSGGVLYAQSTQATHEVQKFPNGAAIRLPPHARIIGDVHLLNTSAAPITGSAKLALYTSPEDEVAVKLVPFHLTFHVLDIPPLSQSRFVAECELDGPFRTQSDAPFAMDLYYSLPHTHALGTRMFLEVAGGPNDGQSLLDAAGSNGEARGVAYTTPVRIEGATGLRFGCEFDNPRAESVHWGFGDQEMCEMLGFADSRVGFESSVSTLDAPGTGEGGLPEYTGPCSTLAVLWDHGE
jgi:hypothetical protein